MRRTKQRTGIVTLVLTGVIASFSLGAARAADAPETQPAAPPPPQMQAPATPEAPPPQGKGKGMRRKQAMHRMKEACGADIKNFCADVKPGEGRIVQCLEQHQAEVSQPCNQLLTKRASRQGKKQ